MSRAHPALPAMRPQTWIIKQKSGRAKFETAFTPLQRFARSLPFLLMSNLACFEPTQEFGQPNLSTVQSRDGLHNMSLFVSKPRYAAAVRPEQTMADKICWFDVAVGNPRETTKTNKSLNLICSIVEGFPSASTVQVLFNGWSLKAGWPQRSVNASGQQADDTLTLISRMLSHARTQSKNITAIKSIYHTSVEI